MVRSRPRWWPFATAQSSQARLLDRLTELQSVPLGGGPDPEFRARLREGLMSASLEAPERAARPSRRRHRAARVPWLSQLVTAGLALSMMASAFVTYQAVPGDTLYPLKRAAESTLLRLSADDAELAQRELISARTRAEEVAALLGSPGGGPHVGATLQEMEETTRSALSKLARVAPRSKDIDTFAKDQREVVEPFLPQMDRAQQDQTNGYLDYIDGLVPPR
ncbi:DUF5667 domain-containing protein [Nonomuraea sp. NPDC046570]|uniref:DUF5667 domain-containing protein n=1 Tax=Nonomuraea sp. NPDC046570 TaxID=3155255 RepID=UPI0033D7028A